MFENNRIFKEPNKINFPDDNEKVTKKSSIYELLLHTQGDYKKVSQILDQKIFETNKLIKELTDNIKSLPDETFEEKLNKLKDDNLETMILCDEFRKIASRKEKEQENFDLKVYSNPKMNGQISKKLYDKPPQIPKPNRDFFNYHAKDVNNHHHTCYGEFNDSHSLDSGRSGNHYGKFFRLWKENEDIDDEEEINRREKSYKREAAMERLTRSKSGSSKYPDLSDKSSFDPDVLVAKWRHKITVPQPFEMTLREETKQKHRQILADNNRLGKSRTLIEFQYEKLEKERQEMEETKKQFKANPVPAHVYIPLYETMQEESNQRRQFIREYNKEILKSMEKPFNFYKRDLAKHKQKTESSQIENYSNGSKNNSNRGILKSNHSERQKTIVRAKEIPKSSTNSDPSEKIKEEELLRLIKAEMRSKQLLEESKMPGNMEERQRIQEEKRRKKQLRNSNLSLRKRSRSADSSRIHKSIPDFSKIHREWEEEIRMSYKEPHVTQPKPFNLLTEQRPHNRSTNDIEGVTQSNYNSSCNDISSRNEWNKSILTALEIARPPTNKSTMLREMSLRNKMIEEETKMHNKAIEQLARKKREMDASEKIRKSMEIGSLPKGEDKRRQKTKELKIETELRKENYQRELDEMKKKVNQQPLLLETSVVKSKPPTRYPSNNVGTHKTGIKKSRNFNGYDERNNFGDPATYRSSTDASGSIDGMNSFHSGMKNEKSSSIIEQIQIPEQY